MLMERGSHPIIGILSAVVAGFLYGAALGGAFGTVLFLSLEP